MFDNITIDRLEQVLAEKGPFETEEEEAACRKLVDELTTEEQETAAKSSYAYFLSTRKDSSVGSSFGGDDTDDKTELRIRFAMREARRHYVGENRDYDKALTVLKEALVLRNEYAIDLVRRIREAPSSIDQDSSDLTDADKATIQRYRGYIEDEFAKQVTLSSGASRDNLVIAVRFPRNNTETDIEAYMITQIYVAERGCAATEFLTTGAHEKLICVSEYANYDSANAPPVWSLRESIVKLQRMYPERLRKMIITDPPFWMRALYNVLYPFLAEKTREKVALTTGREEKEAAFGQIVDNATTAIPLMNDDWTLSMDEVDIETYLNQYMHESFEGGTPPTPKEGETTS